MNKTITISRASFDELKHETREYNLLQFIEELYCLVLELKELTLYIFPDDGGI